MSHKAEEQKKNYGERQGGRCNIKLRMIEGGRVEREISDRETKDIKRERRGKRDRERDTERHKQKQET